MQDYIIIGGGIIGTFIARELSQYETKVTLLEKEDKLAQMQTTHNSALVHSPVVITPMKGYLKSRFALEGNLMFPELVKKFNIPALTIGAYLVAMDEAQMKKAKGLAKGAKARGIAEVRVLSGDQMREEEPNLTEHVVGGLDMPTAMTVDTYALVTRVASNAKMNGATIKTGEAVSAIDAHDDGTFTVHTERGNTYQARHVINAAGIKNAHIASMVETQVPYSMKPRKGEYYVIRPDEGEILSKRTLFPVPGKVTKGVLITPQPDGTVRVGPSAQDQDSIDDDSVTEEGLEKVKQDAGRRIRHIPYEKTIDTYAGVRSTIDKKDFYIHPSLEKKNFIHVAGTDSPGVPAAPAIAKYLVEELLVNYEDFTKKKDADPFIYKD
ncbi:MAG: NAD(P)/FAD-dependent oxidoreductase [Bacillota bacterium]